MATYVRLPKGKMWHIVGRRWQYDTFTVCDRRIPAGAHTMQWEPAEEETCFNCLTDRPWEELEPERANSSPYPGQGFAPPLPDETPKTGLHACPHHWVPNGFDGRFMRCAWCNQMRATGQKGA